MESEAIGTAASHTEFSLMSLIFDADPIVKLVLLCLLAASVWSWMVIAEKTFSLGSARKKAKKFEEAFWSGRTEDFDMRPGQVAGDAASRVFASAAREWSDAKRSVPAPAEAAAIVSRAERSMRAAVDREISKAGTGLGILATIGSASPFIGLFGTVWGIMNAFLNIAAQQDTSLGTVAGPIAEALFATGMGLVAAIPAVIFYNKLSSNSDRIIAGYESFADEFATILSRQLDAA